MNSQEPALMFLYAAEPRHDHEAVHLQLSDMVASGRLGDAIRAAGVKLSDIHLVAFEPVGDHMPHEGISGRPSRHPSLYVMCMHWSAASSAVYMLCGHPIVCAEVSSGKHCQQNMSKPMVSAVHNQSYILTCL